MATPKRKNTDDALLLAFACGATAENAARKAGVSERTAQRRKHDAVFCKQLNDLRADMVQRTAGMLTAASLESVKTLVELQGSSQPAAVRLGAARSVLELGLKVREASEILERLAALETQLEMNRAA